MTFISYAPNFEDVMLWRALSHIDKGFYIDAGAGGPHVDSVTRAFYERGWRGLNLQGARDVHQALLVARPADINLQMIAGASEATVPCYDFGTGCALDEAAARGDKVIKRHLPQQTLAALCTQHAPADIHFARIAQDDAEAALIGLDLIGVRPWIIIVAGGTGEAFLAKARYALAYRDGINHFYLAQEHAGLRDRLALPPNPLDGFVLREDHPYAYSLSAWREQVAQLRAAAANAEAGAQAARDWADARVREREQQHAEVVRKAEEAVRQHHLGEEAAIRAYYEGAIRDLQQSTSWRITRPLRSASFRARAARANFKGWSARQRVRLGALRGRLMAIPKAMVRVLVRSIMSRPRVSYFVRSQIGRHPRLTNLLRTAVMRTQASAPQKSLDNPADLAHMPLSARQVLDDLRRTIHQSKS